MWYGRWLGKQARAQAQGVAMDGRGWNMDGGTGRRTRGLSHVMAMGRWFERSGRRIWRGVGNIDDGEWRCERMKRNTVVNLADPRIRQSRS